MFSHALLTLYRSLARHPLYAALNVLGLAAGIAVFLVLALIVQYESNYDRWLPGVDQVYRLDSTWMFPGETPTEYGDTTFVALPLMQAEFPQIEAGAAVLPRTKPVSAGATLQSETVTYVDANLLDVLRLPVLEGDAARALAAPGNIVISAAMAQKYFGTVHAIGRTLDVLDDGVKRSYAVTAILRDVPRDTTLPPLSLLVPLTAEIKQKNPAFVNWGTSSGNVFLRLRSPADAQAITAGLPSFLDRRGAGTGAQQIGPHPSQNYRLTLVPLPDAHFHDIAVSADVPGADRRVVLSLGAIGLLALITAAINYINLATARADLRAREVALRKVMGASRRMLLVQFLGEAMAMVALAAVIGLALTELAVPAVNVQGGWAMHIDYAQVVPLLLLLVLLLGVGAGAYPAMLLSAYQPAAVLAAARTPSGGRMATRLRNILVLTQFAGAIGFAICTLVIDHQAAYLRDADRGFDRDNLLVVKSLSAGELGSRQNVILDALRRVPGVASATMSDREPDSDSSSTTNVDRQGLAGDSRHLITETIGRDYFKTYGLRLLAGRVFDDSHPIDDIAGAKLSGRNGTTVLNESGAAELGFANPQAAIGQSISIGTRGGSKANLTIVGVVQDVRFMSPRAPVNPQFYLYDTKHIDGPQAAIRFHGVPLAVMTQHLETAWHDVAPDYPFIAATADERLAEFYRPDQQHARLFSAGAILAVGIACLGLYGLASFSTTRRVKEIGIRKTLGASTQDVLLLLVFQFIRPVLIANAIAWPLAWIAMRSWLTGFDQRIALSPGYFLLVGAAALGLSVLTVLGQAVMVARAEPARALRYE